MSVDDRPGFYPGPKDDGSPLSPAELRRAQTQAREDAIMAAKVEVSRVRGGIHERLGFDETIDALADLMDAKIKLALLQHKEPGAW